MEKMSSTRALLSNPLVEIMIVGLLAMVFSGLTQMAGVSGALIFERQSLQIVLTAGIVTMFGLFGVAERRRRSLFLRNLTLDSQKDLGSRTTILG